MSKDFMYQSEKLGDARSTLMLPHPKGDVRSIVDAFHECDIALRNFDESTVTDDNALRYIDIIKKAMDTSGIPGEEKWTTKAEGMSETQLNEFSSAVDSLASWFDRAFWKAHPD